MTDVKNSFNFIRRIGLYTEQKVNIKMGNGISYKKFTYTQK